MKLFIKHLATWLLINYVLCVFVEWDVCILQTMGQNERVLYIFLSVILSACSFFTQLSLDEDI